MTDRASAVLHGRIHARTAFVAAVFALGLVLAAPAVSRAAPSPDAQPGTSAPAPDPAPGAGSAPDPAPPKPAPPAPASTATNHQAPAPTAPATTPEPSTTTEPAPAPAARPATRAADPPRRRARRTRPHARRTEVSLPRLRPPVFPSAVIPLRTTAADRATPSSTDDEGALRLVALVLLLLVAANLGFVTLVTRLRRDWTVF